jgi:hypothetical protein
MQHRTAHRTERCRILAGDISRMIDEFPDPDGLLGSGGSARRRTNEEEGEEIQFSRRVRTGRGHCASSSSTSDEGCSDDGCSDDGPCSSTRKKSMDEAVGKRPSCGVNLEGPSATAAVDVSAVMERIRAKFKLLCTLLRTKQSFDLGKVLESGTSRREREGDDGLNRSRVDGIDAVSTILNENSESPRHVKSTYHGTPGSIAANGESFSAVGSNW